MRAFLRRLGKQHAVVGDDAHGHALHMGKATHQGRAKTRLELVHLRAIDDAGDDFAHVIRLFGVGGNHAVQLLRVVQRRTGFTHRQLNVFFAVQTCHGLARQRQGMGVVVGQMVGHAGQAGVYIAAAQVLGGHNFSNRRLHQGRTAQENGALVFHDDGLVAHGRHIRPAGGAAAHDHRNLRDALGAHIGLVVEDAAKVLFVGEHIVLVGQVGAARVH